MLPRLLSCTSIALCLFLASSGSRTRVVPVIPHSLSIRAAPLIEPKMMLAPELRFVAGWALTAADEDFGGLSALLTDGEHFTALSDKGLILHFTMREAGAITDARIAPLPKGCANDKYKTDRDSEALSRDAATSKVWIAFEWRGAVCRSDAIMARAEALTIPVPMAYWPRSTGPEAMTILADGRFLILNERPANGAFTSPALAFDGDPTARGAAVTPLKYKLPVDYFRPTDAATLPDGRVLILHRNFKPPFRFRAKLSIADSIPRQAGELFTSRVIASFDETGLTDNMEGIAVSQKDGRTFVWMVSDDNYLWLQQTYLLQFELVDPPAEGSGGG
jgi:hypothetical protein